MGQGFPWCGNTCLQKVESGLLPGGLYISTGKPQREGNNFVVPQLNWAWQMLLELIQWTKNQTLLGNCACQPAGFARFSVLGQAFSRAESTLSYVVYRPLVSNYQECLHIGEGRWHTNRRSGSLDILFQCKGTLERSSCLISTFCLYRHRVCAGLPCACGGLFPLCVCLSVSALCVRPWLL